MTIRRKLSAAVLAGGILAGGVVVATPASANDQVTCPTQNNSFPMSHGLEVWTSHGNYCYAGTPGWHAVNQRDVYRITADWNHGRFETSSGPFEIGPSSTGDYQRNLPFVTVYSVTILNG
ncbi:hypothetical protein [Kitasatospora sp. NPDC093806]|uniref:hypothetical protein n=1 Tax=Kitasatospora sp. NPDC093806 TaxID=3155075 RepID=UPI0034227081